jgi:hypothetical protein
VAGRISRFEDGTVDPLLADAEWRATLPHRADARRLEVRDEAPAFLPLSRAELEARLGPVADESVALADVLRVETALDDYLAERLVAALNGAGADIARRLRTPQDAGWMLERLYGALEAAWDQAEAARRRFYEAGDNGAEGDVVSEDGGAD